VLYACRDERVPVVAILHNYRLARANGLFFRSGAVCHDCVHGLPVRAVLHDCYRESPAATAPLAFSLSLHRQAWRSLVSAYVVSASCGPAAIRLGGNVRPRGHRSHSCGCASQLLQATGRSPNSSPKERTVSCSSRATQLRWRSLLLMSRGIPSATRSMVARHARPTSSASTRSAASRTCSGSTALRSGNRCDVTPFHSRQAPDRGLLFP
jgi:hypothetical protein